LSTTRLSVFIASSLDGYIATGDGSLIWLEQAASSDEDYGYSSLLESVDALATGGGTYDYIAHVDPLPFDGRPVFVFTHHPPPPREGSHSGRSYLGQPWIAGPPWGLAACISTAVLSSAISSPRD
jgi:dihydrofolate reductase